ncbi:unnamed protein product [Angiostrongylus costaricensis]|uniref:Secreted protein n=1 Tax=Angiostrongylus costaricensis TaxID=334426 RepID=A0A0R3PZT1_ANGCS|nr:unnamed protein product [Angiostrongylus costaricensis]
MLLLPILFVGHSLAFFFPIDGSGCKCTPCPEPVTCPPGPSCAIPLPCPRGLDYAAPARSGESSQVTGINYSKRIQM